MNKITTLAQRYITEQKWKMNHWLACRSVSQQAGRDISPLPAVRQVRKTVAVLQQPCYTLLEREVAALVNENLQPLKKYHFDSQAIAVTCVTPPDRTSTDNPANVPSAVSTSRITFCISSTARG